MFVALPQFRCATNIAVLELSAHSLGRQLCATTARMGKTDLSWQLVDRINASDRQLHYARPSF